MTYLLVLGRGQIKTDFFIDMEEGNVMDLTAQVLSAQESNGRPIPLTITVKDPDGRSGHLHNFILFGSCKKIFIRFEGLSMIPSWGRY